MPRSKTKKSNNGVRYFVTDRFPDPKDKKKTVEVEVFWNNSIYPCLAFLRGKCSFEGRMYRSEDGALLALRKVVAGASSPETDVS